MQEEKMLIQALKEVYSSNLEEIQRKVQRGRYEFYPNKSLADVALQLSSTKRYRYYRTLNGEIEVYKIVNDLCRLGYQETSTGTILMLESC